MTQTQKISHTWVRGIILVGGIFYLLAGLAMILAPMWFFENIGNFPPFNRHYTGDLGGFLLPLGIGLVIASRDPVRHWTLVWVIVAANVLHALNHTYDAIIGQEPLSHWLVDIVPLVVFAGGFLWAAREVNKVNK